MFIYESSLFAPYIGGLSSYGIFLMIVAFIQMEEQKGKGEEKDISLRTAELLINFLKFYGFKMDYMTQKIVPQRVEEGGSGKTIVYNS